MATELLLAQSARDDLTGRHPMRVAMPTGDDKHPDATVVANVPADLLARARRTPRAVRG